jgi:hypothetical protein
MKDNKVAKKLLVGFTATLLFTGCTSGLDGLTTLDSNLIENQMKTWLSENDIQTDRVECPDSMRGKTGDSWWCTFTDSFNFERQLEVTMTSSDGFVEWQLLP